MKDEKVPTHPVQRKNYPYGARVPQVVSMKAYEVYTEIYGAQEALVTGECRGGFGVGELVAFLYAATFPRTEWRARFEEGIRGMEYLG